ncbi:Ubiquitin-associated protein 2-like [Saguinus oedipus]|uniref:Ubiquitin-associated protein 2-like n=1 Tax=Saguinus oedipus TaxID=9490 RepID=A0ABQ9VBF6_SAGOE|nr:Ubiquitin-associated protein 2-like [Saguinus oedipus]
MIDIMGKNHDECVIALHDCNGDVNRAINVLLEGNPDTNSWEMVRKKKGVSGQKDGGQMEYNAKGKENRDWDRDYTDYAEPANTDDNYGNSSSNKWNNTGHFEPDDGMRLDFIGVEGSNYPPKFKTAPGAWRTATEGRGTEDLNEDLSETKIFTASNGSSVPLSAENVTITASQRIDLAVLLGKTPSTMENDSSNLDPSQAPSLAQPLVFSNSKQRPYYSQLQGTHFLITVCTMGFQFLEQLKTAQALAQLAAQHSQTESTTTSSWDMGPMTQSPSLVQYDLKNLNDTTVHSPFTKCQAFTPFSTMMEVFLQEKSPAMSPGSSDNQSSSPQPAQQKLKQQKKKASSTSKIPALAVEMPGSADISGLNLQFGALQFGSEPVHSDYESTPTMSTSSSQVPSSLYISTASESSSTF